MRDWLKEARLKKGMTQLQVAEQLGITESYYCFIENGGRLKKMDVVTAKNLSSILGVPIQAILSHETGSSPQEPVEEMSVT